MKKKNPIVEFGFLIALVLLVSTYQACEKTPAPQKTESAKEEVVKQTPKVAPVKKAPMPVPAPKPKKAASLGEKLVLLDFNLGEKPNNLGGDLGAWDKDPADDTQTCEMMFEAGDDALGDPNGFSLRLDYDVDSPNPAYNGFWTKLEGEDFSSYSTLHFYLKGDAVKGFTSRLKIEIKDFNGNVAKYLVQGITDSWKMFSVPFVQMGGNTRLDLTTMNEFVIVFDDQTSSPKTGSILIDEVVVT